MHWNLDELNINFQKIIAKTKKSYINIQKVTGVMLHNFNEFDNFKKRIKTDISEFMLFSRDKAQKAQAREYVTQQPKESLSTLSKAKITISKLSGW